MTATIMPASAASTLAPAAAAGGKGADAGASDQPFGVLMEAVQASVRKGGKTALPDVPAMPKPVTARLAGTLAAHAGVDEEDVAIAPPIVGEAEVDPAEDRPADAAATPDDKAGEKPVAEAPVQVRPALPSAADVQAGKDVPGLPERAAEGGITRLPDLNRPRGRSDGKAEAGLLDPSNSTPTAPAQPQPQPAQHAAMAAHLSRPQAMPGKTEDIPAASPGGSAVVPARQDDTIMSDAGTERPSPKSPAPDAGPPAPLPSVAEAGPESPPPGMSFGQALAPLAARGSSQVYGGVLAAAPRHDQPVVSAEAGQMGQSMGVAIARGVEAGRDALLVRLDPAEMGRIHVRLSFDHDGAVHVAMSADSPVALDMLRREAGDLGRALNDAGVRTDSQSFRFDGGGGGNAQAFAQQRGGSEGGQHQSAHRSPDDPYLAEADIPPDPSAAYRGLRSAGGLNLII